MKVVFSSAAKADLIEIVDWIARDSPRNAKAYARDLRAAAARIAWTPYASPVRDHLMPGLRGRPFRSHTLFYTVEPGRVFVRRILHGARDFPAVRTW